MNKEVLKKLIEMINSNLLGLSVVKSTGEKTLIFTYDKKTNQYSYELKEVLENSREKVRESKSSLTLEEIITIIYNSEFTNEFIELYNKRVERERKFTQAKQQMYQEISTMNLSDEEIDLMVRIIEKVSQLPEVVGFNNRVEIQSTPDYYEHVRLTDESLWNNTGDILHLQLIQTMDHGMKFRNYPKLTFEELVHYICEIKLNKESNKVK